MISDFGALLVSKKTCSDQRRGFGWRRYRSQFPALAGLRKSPSERFNSPAQNDFGMPIGMLRCATFSTTSCLVRVVTGKLRGPASRISATPFVIGLYQASGCRCWNSN